MKVRSAPVVSVFSLPPCLVRLEALPKPHHPSCPFRETGTFKLCYYCVYCCAVI